MALRAPATRAARRAARLQPASAASVVHSWPKRVSPASDGAAMTRPSAAQSVSTRAAGGRPSSSLRANDGGSPNAPVSSSSPSLRGMSTAVKSPPSASAAACATASSVAVSESGSPRTVAMLEKPRCTRACRDRSSYVSAFRSASAASEAKAAMTSVSRSPNRRSSRAAAPSTPRVSPESTIGAKILLVNPSYASCGIGRGRRGAARDDRAAAPDGLRRSALVGRELEADEVVGQPVHRRAAQHAPALVVEVDVRGVEAEQRGELVDEPLQHRLDLELGGDVLRGAEQALLEAHLLLALAEQPRDANGEPGLARDGLGDGDVGRGPVAGRRAMQREDADHLVEDDDRRRKRRAGADRAQLLAPAGEGRRAPDRSRRRRPRRFSARAARGSRPAARASRRRAARARSRPTPRRSACSRPARRSARTPAERRARAPSPRRRRSAPCRGRAACGTSPRSAR